MPYIIIFTTSLIDSIVLGLLLFVMASILFVILVQNLVKHKQSSAPPIRTNRINKSTQSLRPNKLSDHRNSNEDEPLDSRIPEMDSKNLSNSIELEPLEKEIEFDINDMSQYYFPDRNETYVEIVKADAPPESPIIEETPLIFIEMPMQEVETSVEIEAELREYVIDRIDPDTYTLFLGGHATLTPKQFQHLRISIRPNKERYPDFAGIYVIWNHTLNKTYVGQSKHVMQRINEHFSGKGRGKTGSAMLHRDYDLGDSFFIAVVPIHDASIKNLNALERTAIAKFEAFEKGYNKTRGNHD